LNLALRTRHVGAVPAIETLHGFRTLADRGAHAIHGRIAATDDHDILARGIEAAVLERRNAVAEPLAVGGGEIVERFDHARRADARRLALARFVDAGCDQDRVVPLAQRLQ